MLLGVSAGIHEKLGRPDEALRARVDRLSILERRVREFPDDADNKAAFAEEQKLVDELRKRLGQTDGERRK